MRIFGLLLLAIRVPLCAQVPDPAPAYSPERNAALGKQLAAEFRRQNTIVQSPSVQHYLDDLGQTLAAQMPEVRLPFTFSTVAADKCGMAHEPVAIPGGYIFIPSGLFLAAQDESEFAGMLAHAMAHISLRHGTGRGRVGNGTTIPLIFVGGMGCSAEMLVPVAFRATAKNYELEADALAIQTMARAGFDPEALVRYIERVQVPSKRTVLDREERISAMTADIEQLGPFDRAARTSDKFRAVQNELREQIRPASEPQDTPSLLRSKPH